MENPLLALVPQALREEWDPARHPVKPETHERWGLHEELAMLAKAGLTPMQALQSATGDAARFLNLEQETGAIAPSRRADLVLLEANPLDDIRNTTKIIAVIRNGEVVRRRQGLR